MTQDDCSLSTPDREARGDRFKELAEEALVRRSRGEQRVRLDYRKSRETEAELRELIRLESECCPFLDFELREESDELTLEIAAPVSASAVLDAIYERSLPAAA